ncbi:MAG: hypothetical protein ABR530_03280 [Pyrinomonadaceae bacterium]
MKNLIIGLVIGLLVGGAITFYLFVGVPRASQAPGRPIQPPDPGGGPAGTAQIVLRQDFFNEVLGTIFRDMNDPAFQLAGAHPGPAENEPRFEHAAFQNQACDSKITILPEGSGVQTGLQFDGNRIAAPLAFSGTYNSLFGCLPFTGWAQTNLELRFDEAQQAVFGQINVETVNLDGVNPVLGGFVTPLVQSTLNSRVNPIQILNAKQVAVDLPIASTGGNLKANVKDVRAEVKDNALNMYVIFAFSGAPVQ